MNTQRFNFPLLAILALSLILRLVSLADHSLWYDEAFAVLFAEKGINAMLYGTLAPVEGGASDIHPLLYYATLNQWMQVFGQSPFAVRLWSTVLGMASIVLIYEIGRRLFDDKTGLAAALVVGLAPFHIHYSQETRMYTLMATLLLASTWAYLRATEPADGTQEKTTWRWWLLFGVCAALAMYTQQLSAFYLVAIGLLPFIRRERNHMAGMVFGTVVALLVYAPWLVNIPSQLEKVNSYYWVEVPGIEKLLIALYLFLTNYDEIPMPYALAGLGGAVLLVMMLFIQIYLVWRKTRYHRESDLGPIFFAMWLFLAPMGLMWLVSQVQPVFLERGLIASSLMLYLLLGWLFTRGGLPRIIRLFLGLIGVVQVVIGLSSQYTLDTFPYAPHHDLIQHIGENWQDGDVVVHMNKLSALPGVYYNRSINQRYISDAPGSSEDTLALPTQEVLELLADPCMAKATERAKRVWFVTYDRAEEQYERSGRTELADSFLWLANEYEFGEEIAFEDINLYLYDNGAGEHITDCE